MPGSCWSEPSRILRSSSSAGSAETRSAARRKARTRYVGSCASSRRNAIRRRAVTARASGGTHHVYLIGPTLTQPPTYDGCVKATPFNQKTIAEFHAKKGRGVGAWGDHVLLM